MCHWDLSPWRTEYDTSLAESEAVDADESDSRDASVTEPTLEPDPIETVELRDVDHLTADPLED